MTRWSATTAIRPPPTLGELIADDHPARYVAELVDRLDWAVWGELGVAPDGEVRGAPGYHPRVLVAVWLYGFMDGVRSSRKLEKACRDQVPYLWLTGWQRPDHNTLWRFYRDHRQAMRGLLKRTVRVAVAAGLVDLAMQAVDGTRVAGSAARERTLAAEGLAALLARTEAAMADLEAQNVGGDDPPPPTLPPDLTRLHTLRDRIAAAQAVVATEDGPTRTNLTDPDATLQKARRGGFLVGYNAQAMVAGLTMPEPDGAAGPGGLLITAADVTTDRDDHAQVVPLVAQAAALTETPPIQVLMPDPQAPRPSQPYHKDRFVYDPTTAT